MNSPKKTQVTLEDLLRVKRAERPPVAFWAEFERDLRIKQLAAIVEPRPWWAPFIRVGTRVARYQLPIGAAAVLTLTFVTMREYQTVVDAPEVFTRPAVAVAPSVQAPGVPLADRALPATTSVLQAPVAAERPAAPGVTSTDVASVGRASHTIPLSVDAPAVTEPTPSARYIAANLAAVQADNPNLINQAFGQLARARDLREPVRDPLAQLSTPRETRRSRLLSAALPASATFGEFDTPSGDRGASRLTEERLYDTISRIGVQGDRVAIRF